MPKLNLIGLSGDELSSPLPSKELVEVEYERLERILRQDEIYLTKLCTY